MIDSVAMLVCTVKSLRATLKELVTDLVLRYKATHSETNGQLSGWMGHGGLLTASGVLDM